MSFDQGVARQFHQGAPTEQAGATKAARGAMTMKTRIIDLLGFTPCCDAYLSQRYANLFGVTHPDQANTVKRRRLELTRAGIVFDTGKTETAPSGLQNTVWGVRG